MTLFECLINSVYCQRWYTELMFKARSISIPKHVHFRQENIYICNMQNRSDVIFFVRAYSKRIEEIFQFNYNFYAHIARIVSGLPNNCLLIHSLTLN